MMPTAGLKMFGLGLDGAADVAYMNDFLKHEQQIVVGRSNFYQVANFGVQPKGFRDSGHVLFLCYVTSAVLRWLTTPRRQLVGYPCQFTRASGSLVTVPSWLAVARRQFQRFVCWW